MGYDVHITRKENWFGFRARNVVVRNPDTVILVKLWQIGQKLGARVQGDDCEIYGVDGNIVES